MELKEVKANLCYYDKRNPDYCFENTADDIPKNGNTSRCLCDNCFQGRSYLANEILRLHDEIDRLRNRDIKRFNNEV